MLVYKHRLVGRSLVKLVCVSQGTTRVSLFQAFGKWSAAPFPLYSWNRLHKGKKFQAWPAPFTDPDSLSTSSSASFFRTINLWSVYFESGSR